MPDPIFHHPAKRPIRLAGPLRLTSDRLGDKPERWKDSKNETSRGSNRRSVNIDILRRLLQWNIETKTLFKITDELLGKICWR
jgi:hypothetical protein